MTREKLNIWNMLTTPELAAMLANGMIPDELPAGFMNRWPRLDEAYAYLRVVAREQAAVFIPEPIEIAVSVNPPKKDNSRPVVSNKPAVRWPSEKAAARALKVRRDTLREILKQNDNGKQLVIGGHVLRHADAA